MGDLQKDEEKLERPKEKNFLTDLEKEFLRLEVDAIERHPGESVFRFGHRF